MRTILVWTVCLLFATVVVAKNFPKNLFLEDNIEQELDETSPPVNLPDGRADEAQHDNILKNDDKAAPPVSLPDGRADEAQNDNILKENDHEALESDDEDQEKKASDDDNDDNDDDVKASKEDSSQLETRQAEDGTSQIEKKLDDSVQLDKRLQREIHRCSLPLGMENGAIPDSAITASSSASNLYRPSRSRLNTLAQGNLGGGSWIAAKNDGKQWLKIDLGGLTRVARVGTQGRPDADHRVKSYTLSYSMDNTHWADYKINSLVKVFYGNTDRNTVLVHNLIPYIEARFVRFNIKTVEGAVAMRAELYGCSRVHSCTAAVGLEDGRIPDSAVSASSILSSAFGANRARLNMQSTAWIPKVQSTAQYLRIDLINVYSITKVTTQGRYNIAQYVKTYNLQYSFDGTHWAFYKQNGNTKVFVGNNDGNVPNSHILNPHMYGRFVEFKPITWQSYIAMRVELYGCRARPGCSLPLGLEDGRVAAAQMTGTSTAPANGRLNGGNAFIAKANDLNQYLQVDFVVLTKVTGVATQGRPTHLQYVKTFHISYSANGANFIYVKDQSLNKVFAGNQDQHTIVRNQFDHPLFARFVRLHPLTFQSHKAFRMELYGCSGDDQCFTPLGVEDGRIGDQLITASSFYNAHYQPHFGRLNNVIVGGNKGSWLAKVNNPNQYLQIDFGQQQIVTKVASQGRFDGLSYVKSFYLSYSQDGRYWVDYSLSNGNKKVFGANIDRQTIRFNRISPSITAKFIRVHPLSWYGHIGMRVEFYGCHIAHVCSMPLGLEDRRIPDAQMTASSVHHAVTFAARLGRLNVKKTASNYGAWCSKVNNVHQFLQIDLNKPTLITKVGIQGRQDSVQYIESFKLSFSQTSQHWAEYRRNGLTVIFPGNFDQNTVQIVKLNPPIYAKYIRIRPMTWKGHVCMRAELYGCDAKSFGEMAITA